MSATTIEWTEQTWNPIVGCSVVSPGCTNCYAMKMAARLERIGQDRYVGLTKPSKAGPVWTGELRLVEDALTIPLRRRKPTTWFVNSMSDLFHESVPDTWIDRVFAVMALAPQHTFQVLTKRTARMRSYCTDPDTPQRVADAVYELWCEHLADGPTGSLTITSDGDDAEMSVAWPLLNVWKGTSAEDQSRADERIPDLLATPAAVRFVSAEPLLGAINFTRWTTAPANYLDYCDAVGGPAPIGVKILDWIIVGSESGPRARPCDRAWVRTIRDQCSAAGVSFFWKQHVENGRKITLPEMDGRTWAELPRSMSAS